MLAGPKHGSLPAAARRSESLPGEGPACEKEEGEVLGELGELAAGVAEAEERRVLLPGGAGLARLAEVRSAGGCRQQPLRVSDRVARWLGQPWLLRTVLHHLGRRIGVLLPRNQRPCVGLGVEDLLLHGTHRLGPRRCQLRDIVVAQAHVDLLVLIDLGCALHGVAARAAGLAWLRLAQLVRAPVVVNLPTATSQTDDGTE